MANQNNDTRNAILRQVELWWPKLTRPTAPFGEDIYDLQVRVPTKRRAELEQFGKTRTVDDAPGMVVLNVRKKAAKSDGSPARKPIVVDGNRDPLDPDTIGNGSIGNIRLRLNDYQIKHPKTGAVTKEGTKAVLEAVQVTKLKIFTPTGGDMNDFDEEEMEVVDADDAPPAPAPKSKPVVKAAAKKPAPKAAPQEDGFGDEAGEEEPAEEEQEEIPAAPVKKVNAGLAKYQAEQAAKKAAAAKAAAKPAVKKPVPTTGKKPVSRGNSDY